MNSPGTNNNITDLIVASSRGDLPRVEALLGEGANPNAQDAFGQTALMYAASAGHASVVETLADAGADLDARNRNHKSAADLASARDHAAVVGLLRDTRMFLAVRDGDAKRLGELLDAGVDPNTLGRVVEVDGAARRGGVGSCPTGRCWTLV